jgi:UPF0755 protein
LKRVAIVVLSAAILVGFSIAYGAYKKVYQTNVSLNEEQIELYLPTHSSYDDLLSIIDTSSWLIDHSSFQWVASIKNLKNHIHPGRYIITDGLSNNDLVNLLRSGNQTPVNITFQRFFYLSDLAGHLSYRLEPDSISFASYFISDSVIASTGLARQTAISLYLPNTYEFYWNTSPQQFVLRMQREYESFWNEERRLKAEKAGLSEIEVSILASIVESETKNIDEMPSVAGLYLNRLKKGMKLQSDPTVKFALGDPTKQRIYTNDLKVNSPYNTYLNEGLPPGPILMPSIQSIESVLNAKDHNYIYMCAKPDYSGYHNFAKTYNQHLSNRKKYQRFLRKEGIR